MFFQDLILIVTRRCNKRCRFCLVKCFPAEMPLSIAKSAVSIFFNNGVSCLKKIKFFGGEPLLNFKLISDVVHYVGCVYPHTKVRFSITSNGSLLDDEKLSFLKSHEDLDIWLSMGPGNRIFLQKYRGISKKIVDRLGVNLVMQPAHVEKSFSFFLEALKFGFKKFNFLPAYYVKWPKNKLGQLRFEFFKISEFLRHLNHLYYHLEIVNTFQNSPTPLFNNGVVIDTDGIITANNLFLFKPFSHLKDLIAIGNVLRPDSIHWNKRFDYNKLMRLHSKKGIYDATLKVDSLLTEFVRSLNKNA